MKIGLVCPYDYSFPGGVVSHIAYLAHYLTQWEHEIKIIAPCSRKETRYFDEEITAVGKPLSMPGGGSVARVPLSPWLPFQIKRILDEENFDIIHIHEPFMPMISLTVLLMSQTINVGTFHAYHNRHLGYWLGRPIVRRWARRLHGKITVSMPAQDYVSRYIPCEYRTIPNGIDTELFSPNGPRLVELTDEKLNILFVGRLEKRKGLDYLLQACGKIKAQFPEFRLIIVGPGTRLRPGYEQLAMDMSLDNVIFTGFIPPSQLPAYYRSADIFCAPSTGAESFGIVLLEAMASGKPVVATTIKGYASVLNHGEEGLLVPPQNEEALAHALLSLLTNNSLRHQMGAKGRIKAENYSWPNIAHQLMDYYTGCLIETKKD